MGASMKLPIILAAALVAAPAGAQQATPIAEAGAPAPVDPARLALARTTVDHFWPIGTYERMMNGTIDQMMDQMFQAITDMKAADMAGPYATAVADHPKTAQMTFRELMATADPHFEERFSIMNRVMTSSMVPMMNRIEPDVREGMARAYARKFTA